MSEVDFVRAKANLQEGNFEEAVSIYQKMLEDPANADKRAQSLSAYSLGIAYSLEGPHQDLPTATEYLMLAEEYGDGMASYFIAGELHGRREYSEALLRFKEVADHLPSAAYWTYRILIENRYLQEHEGEAEEYQAIAINERHLLAMRDDIVDRIKGRKGLLRIPGGLLGYARLFFDSYKAVNDGDKYRYQ